MSFRLTSRDKQLIILLGQHGCIPSDRIKTALWNKNPNSTVHYRRLAKLKDAGFICDVLDDCDQKLGFALSKKGRRFLKKTQPDINILNRRRSYKTQFRHDQFLFGVETILTRSFIVKNFKREAVVRKELLKELRWPIDWSQAPRIPDAMMEIHAQDRIFRIAIELEYSDKSKARVRKMFRQHVLSKHWDIGFFIARDERMLKRLRTLLEETKNTDSTVIVAKHRGGIYFCLLQDLLQQKLDCPWMNDRQTITLTQLAA